MSLLKVVVPLGVVVFVVVSFLFLDGWPFRVHSPVKHVEAPAPNGAAPENPTKPVDAPVPPVATDPESVAKAKLAEAKSGDVEKYLKALSETVLDTRLSRAFREALLPDIRALNDKLTFTTSASPRSTAINVKNGDNLSKIVNTLNTKNGTNITPAFLMKVNKLPNSALRVGQPLNVPKQKLSVHIIKGDFRAYVMLGDAVALDYPVGIGKNDATPEGTFTVKGKTKNPNWTTPDGRVLPYGHPEHIIGSRWMGFDNADGRTTYGIHGTIDEASIGKAESAGCIRMKKVDVEEIFELIPEGAKVVIE